MSYFTDLYASIKYQIENHLKDWKEDNIHDLCSDCDDDCDDDYEEGEQDLEPFFLEYTNSHNSIMYYNIDDDDLDNSYREGSVWIMEQLNEWGVDCDYMIDIFKKISNDNEEYKRHLIYFIGQEL